MFGSRRKETKSISRIKALQQTLAAVAFAGAAMVVSARAAMAQQAGTFVATGNMNVARLAPATLLRDGRVLFTGGALFTQPTALVVLASAEIYDPATGTFAVTGSMSAARLQHSSTLLKDGRILVAGGYPAQDLARSPLASAEIYDPSTGTFQGTGDMITPQRLHTATLLGDGEVLIAGGIGSTDAPALAEIYDPATGTFRAAGNPGVGFDVTATLLADGTVLLVGGYPNRAAVVYDPGAATFSPGRNAKAQSEGTATLLANGNVLTVGGDDGDRPGKTFGDAQLYEPSTGAFKDTGALKQPRFGHTATMLPGGKVLIAGGVYMDFGSCAVECRLASTELYDPTTGVFTAAGDMLASRDGGSATLLGDGTVLLAGEGSAELYTPALAAVSSASLAAPLAPESLGSLFGARLAPAAASANPYSPPTSLGGTSVRVRDSAGVERLARLLYVSPSQIIFEVPAGTALGGVVLQILNGASPPPSVTAQVSGIAPGLFFSPTNMAAAYAMRIEADGKLTFLSAGSPIVLDDRPVYLALFGTGIRGRSSLKNVECTIGGISVTVTYAGPGGGVPGLDQVNVLLPTALKGNADGHLILTVDGIATNVALVDVR